MLVSCGLIGASFGLSDLGVRGAELWGGVGSRLAPLALNSTSRSIFWQQNQKND